MKLFLLVLCLTGTIKIDDPDGVLDDYDVTVMVKEKAAPEPPPEPTPEGAVPQPDANGQILIAKAGTYVLDRDIENTIWIAAPNVHLNLNGHRVATKGHGVRLYVSWHDNNRFGQQQAPEGFILTGPGVIESELGNAVSGRRGYGCVLQDAKLVCNAPTTSCVTFGSLSFTAQNLICVSNVPSVANRMDLLSAAVIGTGNSSTVENCTVIGGQVGIFAGSGSTIRGNFISQNSVATNGYGVATHKGNGVLIENNLIIANNGRGVILNNGTNNRVENNLIFARERPNAEYGSALNPCGIRVRYSANNNTVINNYCLAISMPGHTAASGLYLTNDVGVSNVFRDNKFAAVLSVPPDVDRYAKAVTLEAQGRWSDGPRFNHDFIENNEFVSNHILLSLSGRDGYKNGAHMDNPLKGNSFNRAPGADILSAFFAEVSSRIEPFNDTAKTRLAEIVTSLEDLEHQNHEDGWDVWTALRWRTPVTITIEGDPSLKIRRSAYEGYPVNIRVIPVGEEEL